MNSNFDFYSSTSSSSLSDNEDDNSSHQNFEIRRKIIVSAITQEQDAIAAFIIQQEQDIKHGGSIPGHVVIHRDREIADRNLYNDYFAENPRYNETMFRRRF